MDKGFSIQQDEVAWLVERKMWINERMKNVIHFY